MGRAVRYNSKIVGVTFEGRQAVLSTLKGEESIRVRREADNEYDNRAVAVDAYMEVRKGMSEWLPVGYIANDKNKQIAAVLDAGGEVNIKMSGITGGGDKNYGMNILLAYDEVSKTKFKPSKAQTEGVLEFLLEAIKGQGDANKGVKETYVSRLIGKSIELTVLNGHKRVEGYTGGSSFPDAFYETFDKEKIIKGIVAKHDVDGKLIEAMWNMNRDASTGYGTAIHAVMENFDINHEMGHKIRKVEKKPTKKQPEPVMGPNKALSKNPFLKKIVEDFHKKFGGDYIRFNEEFIWDQELCLCGSVDRIKVIDLKNRVIRIQDYKTDGNIHEKKYQLTTSPFYPLTQGDNPIMGKELLDLHWLQLSVYAFILQRAGWTIEGLDIYWLNPKKLAKGVNAWDEFSHDVIDITPGLGSLVTGPISTQRH